MSMTSPTTMPLQHIPWRMRPDLVQVPMTSEGRPAWGIKDPVSLDYFELREEAHFVLQQLDGLSSLEQICRLFHERFRPRLLSAEELQGFVRQLIARGLVISERPGSGHILSARAELTKSQRRWTSLTNLLAIRFRGADPDRLLQKMLSWLGWIFTPWAVAGGLLLILSAVALIAVHLDELISRLPDAQAFLSPSNLFSFAILLAIVKIVHELGHGLTCKRFGGECHELGVMLLVFTPTLYCNVSDIWMVENKWKRIAVSLAGMWVEALIAAVCAWLWWFSDPGLFHTLCLNLMFLCGINTLIFNGNPLLRYDGYFALADWLEIPNLREQATAAVQSKLFNWFCRDQFEMPMESSWQREWGLIAYGAAASIYRVMLMVLIFWSLHRWLAPQGMGVVVQCLAVMTVGSLVLTASIRTFRFMKSPDNRVRIRWLRGFAAMAFLLLAGNLPMPCRVTGEAIVDDDDAQRVYVTMAGTLIDGVRFGQSVEEGQIVARLDEPRLKMKLIQLQGDLNVHRSRLEQLERRRVGEPQVAQNIPTVREIVRDLEQQLSQLQRDSDRLVLRSPCQGTILPGPRQNARMNWGSLPFWTRSPLDEQNQGSFLREGTIVCLVGRPECRTALVLINQDDVNLVRIGQQVRLAWNELVGEIMHGEIVELSGLDLDKLHRAALGRLNLPSRFSAERGLRPVGKWYQARVALKETNSALLRDSTGQARILVDPQSVFQRLIRWLKQTFPIVSSPNSS